MKKIILFLLITIPIFSFAQEEKAKWDFPVKPGTEEWKKLKNEKERFSTLQVPSEIINDLSTEELIKTCINFPSFGYYSAYENYQTGFLIVAEKFNGLRELPKRIDAFQHLVKIYQNAGDKRFNPIIQGIHSDYWTLRLGWIELLISQKKILKQGNLENQKQLMKICFEKYSLKIKSEEFSSAGAETTLFLMARILETVNTKAYEEECFKNPSIRLFSNTSKMVDSNTPNIILELSQQFISK
ncbi:MAG: hypothetical protein Q8N05_18305 [Bacteroidota bacterium]|nr:hypothetical protein [Bacteroidota bacterium]